MTTMTIGEFSRRTGLSAKALRLYDSKGLLRPRITDGRSGYRYYADDQITRARLVASLRGLGMSLSAIASVVDADTAARVDAVRAHGAALARDVAAKQSMIEFLVQRWTGKKGSTVAVVTREMPERIMVTLRATMTADEIEGFATPLYAEFASPAVARPAGIAGQPFLRYFGELSPDSETPIEFCCPVVDSATAQSILTTHPDMSVTTEDATTYAVVGVAKADSYSAIGFETLYEWLRENNRQAEWKPEQIFVADPTQIGDSETVYEVALPLR